jgi:alkanesulfonate monooxygenase SsuD/methylene tetrahydromethanopterin reductase-like flavin-dependent oxidoreductase (luciferase family)
VVPSPYTRPHPPVFVATAGSPESAEYAARRGFIPLYFTSLDTALTLGQAYVKETNRIGRPMALGQNQALVRMPHIGETMEKAHESVIKYDSDIFRNFYAAMGRHRVEPQDVVKAVTKFGLWVPGTVDHVRKTLVEEYKRFPSEYLTLIYHYAQMPKEEVLRQLSIFMKEIKPALDELTDYPAEPSVAAAGR